MTKRKGEISRARLHREWPHHIALFRERFDGERVARDGR